MLSVQRCSGLQTLNRTCEGASTPCSFGFIPKFPMPPSVSPDCGCLAGAQDARCQQSPAAALAAPGLTRCVETTSRFKEPRRGMRSGRQEKLLRKGGRAPGRAALWDAAAGMEVFVCGLLRRGVSNRNDSTTPPVPV